MLLILTYGIRSDVFFMVLPGFGLAFLWKAFQKNENRNKWKINFRELLLPVLVFFAIGLLFLVEKKAYSGPEWAEFQRFQNARSEVYDYYGVPAYEADPEFFDELGISSEEVRALRHYALYLVDGMDAEMMESLSVEAQRQTDGEPGTMAKIKAAVKLAAEQFFSPEYRNVSLSVAVFFLLAVILLWKREKRLYPLLLLYLCAHGLLWLALGYAGRLPERVAFSLHLVMLGGFGGLFTSLCEKEEDQCPWLRRWPEFSVFCQSLPYFSSGKDPQSATGRSWAWTAAFRPLRMHVRKKRKSSILSKPIWRSRWAAPGRDQWQFRPEPLSDLW